MTEQMTHCEVWRKCQDIISDNIPSQAYDIWFAPVKSVSLENSVLTIEVQSDYVREHIEANFLDLLGKALRRVIGQEARLRYRVRIADDAFIMERQRRPRSVNKEIPAPEVAENFNGSAWMIPGIKKLNIDPHLDEQCTMENFIEGDCNRLARAAGLSIAAKPGRNAFNPLFIYSGPGLGKTHLAQAIGNAVKDKFPDKVVLYVSANTFQNQFMNAACSAKSSNNSNQIADFLRYYQLVDVLIVDDVQELADKKGTQNALFHIFNYLHQCGKQVILTSDKPPVELQGLEQRLLSRFKWGLSAELTVPDFETRLAILRSKCSREEVEIPDDVLRYVAGKVQTNIRELEGTLFSIMAHSTFARTELTLPLVSGLVDKIVAENKVEITVGAIQDSVCNYFDISQTQFLSKTRKREIVQARQIAMYLSHTLTKNSLSTIGSLLGGKDHATVIHACNTVSDLMDTDRTFRGYVTEIERRVTSGE